MLEVAETLFMTRGYAGTSVSEISKRTRVSPRLISAHFGEKADIFAQVIRARVSRAFSLARETSAEGSLEDILFATARFALSSAYSPDAINFVRLVVGEGKRFESQTAEIARVSSDHFYGEMERIFNDLNRRGLIDASDTGLISKIFIDLVIGFSMPQAAMGYWALVPGDAELRAKVHLFQKGLASNGKP